MTEWLRNIAGGEGARFLPVVDMIEQAAADPEWADHVSLLGLTCGTGKSSAISLMIAETVHAVKESGAAEGLLIVSDRKEALKDYLNPTHMPQVKRYLDQSRDMISRMDGDTYGEEKERFERCPVLLMTYSRYFGSDKSYIKSRYLKWGNGFQRTRIIMDEEPPIREYLKIGNKAVAIADSGIRDGLKTVNGEERTWCLDAWEKIRDRVHEILEGHGVQLFDEKGEELFLYKAEEEIMPEEDRRRLESYIQESSETILETDLDTLVYLDEIFRIIFRGGYGCGWRTAEGNLKLAFYTVRNNGQLMQDMGAKIVVLDGTADISTAYDHEYIHPVPCGEVNVRQFPELTIRLVDLNTSQSAFKQRGDEIIQTVRDYLEKAGENSREFMVITHSGRPEDGFRSTHRYRYVEHIGNTRGRNDLSESHRVAQAGILRKPPLMYTLEWFDDLEEKAHGEESLSSAVWEYPEENIDGFLHTMNNEAVEPYDRMVRTAAADFEQNVFRTAIRKHDNTEPVTYYLFADMKGLSWLLEIITDRFHNKYGSTVIPPDVEEKMIRDIRRNGNTAAHRLVDWLAQRSEGEIFAKKDMFSEASLTEIQFVSVKKDHDEIAEWFGQMAEAVPQGRPRKGYYVMLPEILEKLR